MQNNEKNKIEVINSKDIDFKIYELKEDKALLITNAFQVKELERNGYIKVYEQLLTEEMTPDLCDKAERLRKDLVKVRTGIDKVHKAEKAYYLAAGKYCDALKNKLTLSVEQMEERLEEVANYYINQEKERKEKLKAGRLKELERYPDFNMHFSDSIADMDDESFNKLLEEQEELKKIKEEKLKKEQEEAEKKAQIEALKATRLQELAKLSNFIKDYDSLKFVELPEEEYLQIIRNASIDKMEFEDKQNVIAEQNAKLKQEAEAKEKELKDLKDKQEKELAEAKEKEEKLKKEISDKEEAEKKRISEEKAKAEAEEKEKAAALKAEEEARLKAEEESAKAPRKEKLLNWVNAMHSNTPQIIEDDEVVKLINKKFEGMKNWAIEEINKL